MVKKDSKERLFEVMGRVAPNFTNIVSNNENISNPQAALDMQHQIVVAGRVDKILMNKFMEFYDTLSDDEKEEFKNIRWEEIMKNTPKQKPEMGAELADYER